MIIIQSTNTIGNITTLDESVNGEYKLALFTSNNFFYNVNNSNNKIYINVNSTDYIATLTNGFYTPTTFISHLGSVLTSTTGEIFTITKNDTTKKFTTSCPTNFKYTFSTNTTTSASKLIGIDTDTTLATSITSTNTWDLSPIKLIFVNIHQDKNKIFNTNIISSSFVISTDTEFGNVIKYPKYSHDIIPIFNFNETKHLNIDLVDIDGNIIDFNGQNWIIILEKN